MGAGLSGLSAAHFYLQDHPRAHILLLDNHPDRLVRFDLGCLRYLPLADAQVSPADPHRQADEGYQEPMLETSSAEMIQEWNPPVDAGPLRYSRELEAMQRLYGVPFFQRWQAAWEFYFRRSYYLA